MRTSPYARTPVYLLSGPRLLPQMQLSAGTPVRLQRRRFGRGGQRGKPVGASNDKEPKTEEPKPTRRAKQNETQLFLVRARAASGGASNISKSAQVNVTGK